MEGHSLAVQSWHRELDSAVVRGQIREQRAFGGGGQRGDGIAPPLSRCET